MADLASELVAAIQTAFTRKAKTDIVIKGIINTLDRAGVTYREAEEYAARIGELMSQAMQENISADMLPDGRMPAELAEAILRPLLSQNYEEAARIAAQVQDSLNRRAGLGMRALQTVPNQDRLEGLVNKIASYEKYEDAAWLTGEPVVNYTQSAVEDTIRTNADAHFKAGLSPKIKRIATGNCCKWCRSLAGTYDYPVPREIYRRHENCRCLVLYDPGDGKIQNSHTKKVYNDVQTAERESRIERVKQLGADDRAMYHRRTGQRGKEVIDQPTYNKLTRDVLRTGGDIRRGGEEAKILRPEDGALYFRGERLIIFREDATISEVLEETYHDLQERKGMFLNYPDEEIEFLREIDAAKYVMSLQNRYKIPEIEMEELRVNLHRNEILLDDLRRVKK